MFPVTCFWRVHLTSETFLKSGCGTIGGYNFEVPPLSSPIQQLPTVLEEGEGRYPLRKGGVQLYVGTPFFELSTLAAESVASHGQLGTVFFCAHQDSHR